MRRSALAVGAVVLAAAGMFLVRPPFEQINLREGDEIWFLETAMAMADGQDSWLWPAASDKPPGFLAMMALSFRAFGLSVWAGRLPSAVMMVLAAFLTARAGRRVGGPWVALVAGMALLAPPMLYAPRGAWMAVTEPALVAAMAGVLATALRIVRPDGAPDRAWLWGGVLGAWLGWMTLLKTAIVLLPMASLGVAVAVVGAEARRRLLRAAPWTALSLGVTAGAWPAALLVAGRRDYLEGIWLAGGLAKIGEVVGGGAREPFYLLHYTAGGMGSFLAVAGLALLWGLRPGEGEDRAARRLAAVVVLTTCTLFSLTATQWPWYSVPAFPALALLVGMLAADAARRPGGALAAALAAAVVLGLLLEQPRLEAFDALNPEWGVLEVPFGAAPGPLAQRTPGLAVALGVALPLTVLLGWRRLDERVRQGLAGALVLTLCATLMGSLVRMLWFPEVRPDPPALTLVDLALAKEARGGEEDYGLNGGYHRLHLAMAERARPSQARRVTVRATGSEAPLRLERARPVQPFDPGEEFPGVGMTQTGAGFSADLEVALGPEEPLVLRLRAMDTEGGTLESVDCVRVLRLGEGSDPVSIDLRFGRLLPEALPAGARAEVYCAADRPHFRNLPMPRD